MKTIGLRSLLIALLAFIISCGTIDPKTGLISSTGSKQHGILTSKEGIEFKVHYYPSNLPKAPAILLLPGNERRNYFGYLPIRINKSGFNVLVITNYYGFNDPSGSRGDAKELVLGKHGGIRNIVANEVTASVNFLRNQGNVDPDRIGILGSSMGTALAILMAEEDPQIRSLVIVSPGRICGTYFEHKKLNSANTKLLLIASHRDMMPGGGSSVNCAEPLAGMMPKAKIEKKYYDGTGHGMRLLQGNSRLHKLIIRWFNNYL